MNIESRDDYENCACMVFDGSGNAFDCFDYTPEALEERARELRKAFGEVTTITYGPSPFVQGFRTR